MFNLTPQEQRVILFILIIMILGAGYQWYKERNKPKIEVKETEIIPNPATGNIFSADQLKEPVDKIVVQINGAIKNPGVYNLPRGSRVIHLIQAAGDTIAGAYVTELNYARPLQDGEKIEIPILSSTANDSAIPPPPSSPPVSSNAISPRTLMVPNQNPNLSNPQSNPGSNPNRKININTATLQELDSLPGIGTVLAQRIIDYRQQHGPFRSIYQIKEIDGIGERRFEDIKDRITVY